MKRSAHHTSRMTLVLRSSGLPVPERRLLTSGPLWLAVSALLVALMGCLLSGCAPSATKSTPSPTARAATFTCSTTPAATSQASTQATALAQVVCQALKPLTPHIARVVTTYDARQRSAQAQVTFSDDVPVEPADIKAAQERVKTACFLIQRALWTRAAAPVIPLQTVTVLTLGETLGDYADKVIAGYGAAQLTAATSAHMNWPTLTADSAWDRYDTASLTPDYAPFHTYGA